MNIIIAYAPQNINLINSCLNLGSYYNDTLYIPNSHEPVLYINSYKEVFEELEDNEKKLIQQLLGQEYKGFVIVWRDLLGLYTFLLNLSSNIALDNNNDSILLLNKIKQMSFDDFTKWIQIK